MNSYNVQVHSETDRPRGRAKQPWAKPSVEIIALETAEAGLRGTHSDGGGGHYVKPRS